MKGHLVMSIKELQRKSILERVENKEMSLIEASMKMELSYRQAKRVWKRFKEKGASGLAHKSRGRRSNRSYSSEYKEKVLSYYRYYLEGFGPTLASEKLQDQGMPVDHETLRRWLLSEHLWKKQRKRSPYRQRRTRRERFGDLVQMDGSFHDWFSNGRKSCLMNLVDDATGTTQALLFEEETTKAAMRSLEQWIKQYGIPAALYTDKRNVYVTKAKGDGSKNLSVFGQVCARLGIEIITAHTPQAKGRVERSHGVYQDRLVREIKYRGLKTLESVNRLRRQPAMKMRMLH